MTRTPTGQLHAFRIYPCGSRSLWFLVRVFSTKAAFHRFVRRHGRPVSKGTEAMVIPLRLSSYDRRWRTSKFAGEVLFYLSFLRRRGATAISHESVHVGMALARRLGFVRGLEDNLVPASVRADGFYMRRESPEERLAYAVDASCRGIVNACYDLGVFPA